MRIILTFSRPLIADEALRTQEILNDSPIGAIMAICDCLSTVECASFEFQCCEIVFPVDVRTDLCVVVEQLPALILQIKSLAMQFTLDLYEQGIESSIAFSRRGDCYVVTINPDHREIISAVVLCEMFEATLNAFVKFVDVNPFPINIKKDALDYLQKAYVQRNQ